MPIRLLPVAEARDADALFASGDADAMLAMTYMGARKRMSGAVPDLRLHSVTTRLERIAQAYARAADRLMSEPGRHAQAIGSAFETRFAALGSGAPPGTMIATAVEQGDLVYRSDVALDTVRGDLSAWLSELIGRDVDAAFLGRS